MANIAVKAGHLAARLLGVALPMGLTLDEILLEGEDLKVETEPVLVTMPAPGDLTVRVGETSLARFLDFKAPGGLRNFQVKLAGGQINVQAVATLIIPLNVGAVCKLRIEQGKQIFVDLVRVDAIGGAGVFNMVQKQLDGINPILDTETLPLAATLEKYSIEDGWLTLSGKVSPR